ncbi:MAG: aminoacyl-tRNA hydrolase [Opitutales bacterium]
MAISFIAGLGNPGLQYQGSRHNIGFAIVDALAEEMGATWKSSAQYQAHLAKVTLSGRQVWLVKPQTFMNESGRSLGSLARFYKALPETFAVVYDDITIDVGRFKISVQGGAGGHNGVASLLSHLGAGFSRLRIGVGAKAHPEMDLKDHVLGGFDATEEATIRNKMPEFIKSVKLLVDKGAEDAMNLLNQKPNTTEVTNITE